MKKLLIILLGTFAFACGDAGSGAESTVGEENTMEEEEDVDIGSGEEISPQLEYESDSAEQFGVDTVSSATEINQEQQ